MCSPPQIKLSESLVATWLRRQCEVLSGVQAAWIQLDHSGSTTEASWPKNGTSNEHLAHIGMQTRNRNQRLVRQTSEAEHSLPEFEIALPILSDEKAVGVVVLLAQTSKDELDNLICQIERELTLLRHTLAHPTSRDRHEGITAALVSSLVQHRRAHASVSAAATLLAQRFRCERAAIGWGEPGAIRLLALSHGADFDPRSHLVRSLEQAMDETCSHGVCSFTSDKTQHSSNRTHLNPFSFNHGSASVCCVPLQHQSLPRGALILERSDGQPFTPQEVSECEALAELIGPLIELRLTQERPLLALMKQRFHNTIASRFGNQKPLRFASIALALIGLIAYASGDSDFRVAAPATVEGSVQRAVVAPYPGYLVTAPRRAGDTVTAGELLATLDDRDLRLERRRLVNERGERDKQYRQALAQLDHAQARILQSQLAQAEAQLELIQEQLSRTRLTAPFDGIIISGDLSQALGTPVERGQVLFELAPLDDYRIVLEVDERDIAFIAADQRGEVTLNALPHTPVRLQIRTVLHASQSTTGNARFRVEATLPEPPPSLRPGMEGLGKVTVGQRRRIWIWTRRLADWFRLSVWSWLP